MYVDPKSIINHRYVNITKSRYVNITLRSYSKIKNINEIPITYIFINNIIH